MKLIEHEMKGYNQCRILLAELNSLFRSSASVPMAGLILGAVTLVFASLVRVIHSIGPIKAAMSFLMFGAVIGVAVFMVKISSNLA